MRDGSPNKWGHNPIYWDLTKLFLLLNFLYCKMSGVYLDELSPNNQVHDRGWIILYCPIHFFTLLLYLKLEVFGNFLLENLAPFCCHFQASQSVSQCVISANWIDLDWMFCSSFLPSLQLYKWFSDIFYQIMKLICEKLPASDWKYFIAILLIISTFPTNNVH